MITIETLGAFDIKIQNESILDSIGNQTRLIKLFKYFLTFEGKRLMPDRIIDEMWQDEESKDPLNVLRTQICRIRSSFNKKNHDENFFQINYVDGYYLFQLNEKCQVDFMQMESYMKQVQDSKDREKVLESCKKIIELYRGEYLGEVNNDWVVPIRIKYNRLYISTLSKYLSLLKEMSLDSQIITICENAMTHIPYEEIIHLHYIESLVKLDQIRCALSHYTYYTAKIYNDLGGKPSNQMLLAYKNIKSKEKSVTTNIGLGNLENELMEYQDLQGALLCDNFYFKFLYNLKQRLKERSDNKSFIGILTLDKKGLGGLPPNKMAELMKILLNLMCLDLRMGDVITQWNSSQVLVMLEGLEEKHLKGLVERLNNKFKDTIKNEKVVLSAKFKEL